MPKKVSVGIVTSDRMAKTRRVEIARLVRHPKYGKYMRRRTICYVHDENGESHTGDTVEDRDQGPAERRHRSPPRTRRPGPDRGRDFVGQVSSLSRQVRNLSHVERSGKRQ